MPHAQETAFGHTDLTRADVEQWPGTALLVFGTDWCGHCQAAAAPLTQALAQHPGVHCVRVEDGPGRPLGRSFKVKLWPTLVWLRDGQEVARVVRPTTTDELLRLLAQ